VAQERLTPKKEPSENGDCGSIENRSAAEKAFSFAWREMKETHVKWSTYEKVEWSTYEKSRVINL